MGKQEKTQTESEESVDRKDSESEPQAKQGLVEVLQAFIGTEEKVEENENSSSESQTSDSDVGSLESLENSETEKADESFSDTDIIIPTNDEKPAPLPSEETQSVTESS